MAKANAVRRGILMIAIMCDALELGRFERDANNILRLKLHDGVNKSW